MTGVHRPVRLLFIMLKGGAVVAWRGRRAAEEDMTNLLQMIEMFCVFCVFFFFTGGFIDLRLS